MQISLSSICEYRKGKVAVSSLNEANYISTENMLPNKGGVTAAASLPKASQTQRYCKGDVLVSNIRPYFKKIWQATCDGGCSNDVLVFQAKDGTNPDFLYYVLSDDSFFTYSTATSKGTKMPRGDKASIMRYSAPFFPVRAQKAIAGILGSLDDKIALNNRINDNLQQQLYLIFQSNIAKNPSLGLMEKFPLNDLCTTVTKGTTPTTLGKPFVARGELTS